MGWPPRHQTLRWEPGVTSSGRRAPFAVGCHSRITCGGATTATFRAAVARFPAQNGHPCPSPVRFWTLVRHS
jgi:hypothetical protein